MGNQFDGDKFPQEYPARHKESPQGADLLLDFLTSSSNNAGKSVNRAVDETLASESLVGAGSRLAYVLGTGTAKSTVGFGNAIVHDLTPEHWGETALKAGTAFTIGLGMRALLPKAGAVKAIVGTIMGVSFVKDALMPGLEAGTTAWSTRSRADLDKAANKMGDGYGMFALDSIVGIKLGMKGEHVAGKVIDKHFPGFEIAKSNMFNSERFGLGKTVSSMAKPVEKLANNVENNLTKVRDGIQGKIDESNLARIKQIKEQHKRIHEVEKLLRDEKTTEPKAESSPKAKTAAVAELPVAGQDKYIYDSANLEKIGKLRERTQNERSLEKEKFDHLQNEFIMPSEIAINPDMTAKMSPAYRQSTDQIHALAKRITNERSYNEFGEFLEPHRVGRMQQTYGLSKTVDLNNYMIDSWKIKVRGLTNKAGLPPEIISKNLPPYSAVLPTNDGPYILPSVPGLIDCAVTVAEADARLYRDGVAYSHEGMHDWYNQFLRFDDKHRSTWLRAAAKDAMKKLGITNEEVKLSNGKPLLDDNGKPVMMEDLIIDIAKAQPNENGCDWTSMAFSGHALPVQYGGLEISWTGKLGKDSYKSPAFVEADSPGGYEVHNVGASRIKTMARVMQLRAPNHEKTQNIANALINWANKFAPPNDKYRWEQLEYNDKTGQHSRTGVFVEVPVPLWDTAINNILEKQLFQPLERLQGKRWHDCLPDQAKVTERVESLSDKIAEAVMKDQDTIHDFGKYAEDFNSKLYDDILGTMSMVDVFNAGPIAEAKVFASGLAEKVVDQRMEKIHSWLRKQFRDDQSEPLPVQPATSTPNGQPLSLRLAQSAIDRWNRARRLPEAAATNNIGAATGAINLDLLMREHELKKALENNHTSM